jgi:hypothetical protein
MSAPRSRAAAYLKRISTTLLIFVLLSMMVPGTDAMIYDTYYTRPTGYIGTIAKGPDGTIYFTNYPATPGSIYALKDGVETLVYTQAQNYAIYGVAVDRGGTIYFSVPSLRSIYYMTPGISPNFYFRSSVGREIHALAVDSNGVVYYSSIVSEGYNYIYKVEYGAESLLTQVPSGSVQGMSFDDTNTLYYTDGSKVYRLSQSSLSSSSLPSSSSSSPSSSFEIYVPSLPYGTIRGLCMINSTHFLSASTSSPGTIRISKLYGSYTFTVTDSSGKALAGSELRLTSSSASSYSTLDPSGRATLILPWDVYNYSVLLNGTTVLSGAATLRFNSSYSYSARAGPVTFSILDSGGSAVSGALISLVPDEGVARNLTSPATVTQLPFTPYSYTVSFRGATVASGRLNITSAGTVTIPASIYTLNLTAVDPSLNPVKGATIRLTLPDGTVLSSSSPASFKQIPAATIKYEILLGKEMVGYGFLQPSSSAPINITASLYSLNVTALRSDGTPLPGANFRLTSPSGTTWTYTTPAYVQNLGEGTYSLEFFWQNVTVGSANVSVPDTTELACRLSVYSPSITVVATDGTPMAGASLQIIHPNSTAISITSPATLSDLPGGNYPCSVLWQGVEVANLSLSVGPEQRLTVSANASPLLISLVDLDSLPVDAALRVTHPNGSTVSGRAPLDMGVVPNGVYTVTATLDYIGASGPFEVYVSGGTSASIPLPYHSVTLNFADSEGSPLRPDSVRIESQSVSLAAKPGSSSMRIYLPGDSYLLRVFLYNYTVCETRMDISGAASITVPTSAYSCRITVRDTFNSPIPGAKVSFSSLAPPLTATTDELGAVTVVLPSSDHTLSVTAGGDAATATIRPGQTSIEVKVYRLFQIAAIAGAAALSAFGLTVAIPRTRRALVGSIQAVRARIPIQVEVETGTGTGIRPVGAEETEGMAALRRDHPLKYSLLKKYLDYLKRKGIRVNSISVNPGSAPEAMLEVVNDFLEPATVEIHMLFLLEKVPTLMDWLTISKIMETAASSQGVVIRPVVLAEEIDIASFNTALANLKKPIYYLTERRIEEE